MLVRPTDHPWLMVGWPVSVLGDPPINNLLRPWNQLKMVKMSQSMSVFYLGISTNGHMISVESYVQFHSEIFSAKPKEFIGRQTDHRWWDLVSPIGFMGHIWRPGDHISAALNKPHYIIGNDRKPTRPLVWWQNICLNLHQCVNERNRCRIAGVSE